MSRVIIGFRVIPQLLAATRSRACKRAEVKQGRINNNGNGKVIPRSEATWESREN